MIDSSLNQQPTVVGMVPWLPWPLSRWRWWTEPVRAERLAALRIGCGMVLLLDVLITYLPYVPDLFGVGSLGAPGVFGERTERPHWNWSLLRNISDYRAWYAIVAFWALAAGCLMLGLCSRASAALAWVLSVSILNLNNYIHNAGDHIRILALFYLMLSPCGAVWSLDEWRAGRGGRVWVSPWALRLLFVQLLAIYCFSGIIKMHGSSWRSGAALHYMMGNVLWMRTSFAQLPIPFAVTQALTWAVPVWEMAFPLLVLIPLTRKLTLWSGVAFHVVSGICMELGPFPFYMLCLYLPLVPWERYADRWRKAAPQPASAGAVDG